MWDMTFIDFFIVVVCNIIEKWMISCYLLHIENVIYFSDIFYDISINIAYISVKWKDSRCKRCTYCIYHQYFVVCAYYEYSTIQLVSSRWPLWEFEITEDNGDDFSIVEYSSVANMIFVMCMTSFDDKLVEIL